MGKEIILHLQDIYKRYGQKTILNDIDLEVSEGEFVSVVGPSGCGKSTLLRLILGQEHVTKGKIFFDGKVIEGPSVERGIVYQKYGLFPNLTVLENVILGKKLKEGWAKLVAKFVTKSLYVGVICLLIKNSLDYLNGEIIPASLFYLLASLAVGMPLVEKYVKKMNKKACEVEDEGREMLKRVGLEQHANKFPHELSGGMQQRVAIAQALIMRPKILMMDEPFGALDPGTRENLQLFLMELWQKQNKKADEKRKYYQEMALKDGKSYEDVVAELSEVEKSSLHKMTIFFVTHDLEEAVFVGSRLLVVSQYYTDLNQQGYVENQGAKIVSDYALRDRNALVATSIKESSEFGHLIAQIRSEGFDPKFSQKVTEFNLKHADSFATFLPKDEVSV